MPLIADENQNTGRACLHGVSGDCSRGGVNWDFYEAVLEEVGNRPIRVTYDGGELEIVMPPSTDHAEDGFKISGLVRELCSVSLHIQLRGLGNATWRRKELDCGLEADESFYIQSYRHVSRNKSVDIYRDPPPDLALEVDISRSSKKKQAIYARLGVPELWRDDKGRLTFFVLRAGKYERTEYSLAFPGLTAADVERFVKSFRELDFVEANLAFRKWVRKNLKKPAQRPR